MQCNEVYFAGNAGERVTINVSQSGSQVANFSLCHSYKKKDGTDEATWMDVVCFQDWLVKQVEQIKKGDNVLVNGQLRVSKYTGSDGIQRVKTSIIAKSIMIQPKIPHQPTNQCNGQNIPHQKQNFQANPFQSQDANPFISDDDIPF